VSGWSAGGHLTAMALDHPRVAAGLAISGIYELSPIRDTYLDEKLRLTDAQIATLPPLRLPAVPKLLAISYGTAELPALVVDSRDLHAHRIAANAPGPFTPISGADHFTILEELRRPEGKLVRGGLRRRRPGCSLHHDGRLRRHRATSAIHCGACARGPRTAESQRGPARATVNADLFQVALSARR
jgi:hypothetical protein